MIDKELKKVREKVKKIYKEASGEGTKEHPISWCIGESWDDAIKFTKEKISNLIFSDIDEAIKKTVSPTPVPIEDSEFMKELKKLKKRYVG